MVEYLISLALICCVTVNSGDHTDDLLRETRHALDVLNSTQLLFPSELPSLKWAVVALAPHPWSGAGTNNSPRNPIYGRVSECNQDSDGGYRVVFGDYELVEPTLDAIDAEDTRYEVYLSRPDLLRGPDPLRVFYSVFDNPSIILCPLESDGWPALHGEEEDNYLVPKIFRDDAIELVRARNHWLEEGDAPVLSENNAYFIVGSIMAEDIGLWDRAWEGDGLLNACITLRVAKLGDSVEALNFTGVDLIRARLDTVDSYKELYWILVAFRALRYTRETMSFDVETEINPVYELIRARFTEFETSLPSQTVHDDMADDDVNYRAALCWMMEQGHFNRRLTLDEQLEQARQRRLEQSREPQPE